ncbi:cytochrome c oxidase assembly factor CtaG [Alkalihalobacterium sp. APHAB7]|uniref:cytochrome c oxidase assembly factor CtaG n=1 Tax=Alkalihalobacterium sp. APHAB7 TaxID=3402081 RepID=UPI003AABA00F
MLQQLFTNFGFRALWTPELIVILIFVGFLYFRLVGKWRNRFVGAEPVSTSQKTYFILGLFALYLGWGSPLYVAGHLMISFHMAQMVFAYFIAVPLFILGMPKWVFHAIIQKAKGTIFERVGKLFFSPLIGVLFFNFLFSVYHLPNIFDFLMKNIVLHSGYEMLMFVAATLMWWHMIAPIPSKAKLSDLRRMGYIFANGILITPACALIIFAPTAMYSVYTDPNTWATVMAFCLPAGAEIPYNLFSSGTNPFSPINPRSDQQLAGILMKIMQEITYGFTLGYVFKQWIKKEKQSEGPSISDIPATHTIKN